MHFCPLCVNGRLRTRQKPNVGWVMIASQLLLLVLASELASVWSSWPLRGVDVLLGRLLLRLLSNDVSGLFFCVCAACVSIDSQAFALRLTSSFFKNNLCCEACFVKFHHNRTNHNQSRVSCPYAKIVSLKALELVYCNVMSWQGGVALSFYSWISTLICTVHPFVCIL